MGKKILVPMKRNDLVEDFIPYIENVASRGMKVVFMVPYPVAGLRWSTEEFGIKAIDDGLSLASYYTWDTNVKKAKARVAHGSAALQVKGVEVTADLYTGSIRSAVREYTAKDDIHLIVTRAGFGQKIAGLLNGSSSLFDLFKGPAQSPVLMIQPGVVAQWFVFGLHRDARNLQEKTESEERSRLNKLSRGLKIPGHFNLTPKLVVG